MDISIGSGTLDYLTKPPTKYEEMKCIFDLALIGRKIKDIDYNHGCDEGIIFTFDDNSILSIGYSFNEGLMLYNGEEIV